MATTPWQDSENRDLVDLYFRMLDRATAGKNYNKAAMIREAQGLRVLKGGINWQDMDAPLANRSRGSIEAKLMNASAAHRDILQAAGVGEKFNTMATHGYKAWGNYQASLKDAMALKIETRRRCYIGSDGRRYA